MYEGVCLIRILDVKNRSDGGESTFEELMAKNFSKLMNDNNPNPWIREVH